MSRPQVRVLCICVIKKDDSILVSEGYDRVKKETFYRPLGGTLEFGERGRQTVEREVKEEIGADLTNIRYLGAIENIFTYEGRTGHEIVLVYQADFTDPSLYERTEINGLEEFPEGMLPIKAVWKPTRHFRMREIPLYPDGLIDLVDKTV